jgi:hypothetical protein
VRHRKAETMLKELEIMQLWSAGKRRTGGSELQRVWESTPKCVVGVGHAFRPLFLHISTHIRGRGISALLKVRRDTPTGQLLGPPSTLSRRVIIVYHSRGLQTNEE